MARRWRGSDRRRHGDRVRRVRDRTALAVRLGRTHRGNSDSPSSVFDLARRSRQSRDPRCPPRCADFSRRPRACLEALAPVGCDARGRTRDCDPRQRPVGGSAAGARRVPPVDLAPELAVHRHIGCHFRGVHSRLDSVGCPEQDRSRMCHAHDRCARAVGGQQRANPRRASKWSLDRQRPASAGASRRALRMPGESIAVTARSSRSRNADRRPFTASRFSRSGESTHPKRPGWPGRPR